MAAVETGGERRVKRIALVGMGRSGTSFLAHFLSKSGVFFDQDSFKSRKLEHPMAREINDMLFTIMFGAKTGLPFGILPASEIHVGQPWPGKVAGFLKHMDQLAIENGTPGYWAVKDPRTTILHSLWLDQFDVIVAIFRNPYQVVGSYLKQGWIHGPRKRGTALRYWTRFNESLLAIHSENHGQKPMYVLDFNADMPRQLANLCERLAIPQRDDAFALYRDTADWEAGRLSPASRQANKLYAELLKIRNLL
jgi:hypothetical protein